MPAHEEELNDRNESVRHLGEPGAAARRDGEAAGGYHDDTYKPGDGDADVGLIAGHRDDPVVVCGVGYPSLSDLAFGTVLAYHVAALDIPGVAVADASHTPITAYQTLDEGDYSTAIVVGAEKRGGGVVADGTPSRTPGKIREFDAREYPEPHEEELVNRVAESALGSNTVDNVVHISAGFGALPETTHVVTVEVGYDSWGMNVDEFTDPVNAARETVLDRVVSLIDDALEFDVRTDHHRHHRANGGVVDTPSGRMDTNADGDDTTPGDALENERVDVRAIDRLDDDARTKLLELDVGVVAGEEE